MFKPGDIVKCINDNGVFLTNGLYYKVVCISENGGKVIAVVDDNKSESFYFSNRFIKVESQFKIGDYITCIDTNTQDEKIKLDLTLNRQYKILGIEMCDTYFRVLNDKNNKVLYMKSRFIKSEPQPQFNIGDSIVCIDDEFEDFPLFITENKQYVIMNIVNDSYGNPFIYIIDDLGKLTGIYTSRFKKINKENKKTVIVITEKYAPIEISGKTITVNRHKAEGYTVIVVDGNAFPYPDLDICSIQISD